ncbi:MAG: hypothetical protein ACPLRN_01475 [Microgenomates group bacterium]
MKKLVFFISLFFIIFFLGRDLLPTNDYFFTFHDETQPARIQQFTKELKNFHIPPRVAPDMNYQLGFPIFNFYAPTAYWITSIVNLMGFNIINSLKISFLLGLIIGFYSSFLFFANFFDFFPSILGAIFYVTSLYFPLDIFVRGNLSEVWFLALLPLTLHSLYQNSQKNNPKIFFFATIFLFSLLTSHNIYSLLIIPFILIFILISKNFKKNLQVFIFACLLSTYFWLPVFVELKYTWAKEVAKATNYQDHFLCWWQMWHSPWGFGGSNKGCFNDGMSFKIGKPQLIFFILGLIIFIIFYRKKDKYFKYILLLSFYTISNLFLTLYQSKPIWDTFSIFFSMIQFPWRFIGLSILGIAFFSAFFFEKIKFGLKNILIILAIVLTLFLNQKYFYGQKIANKKFEETYLSQSYIKNKVAYKAAEYLPKTVDYKNWRNLENKDKIPTSFLKKITIKPFDKNKQTPIERISNIITLITFLFLLAFLKKPKIVQ